MATPGRPRPGNFPPNYNPNALANNMQNLQINQQQSSNLGGSAPRPPNASPFDQQPPHFTGSRSRPPPPGVFPGGPVPPRGPAQSTLPPNIVSSRPSGTPPVSQPPPFASRPPPPGALPSSAGGPQHFGSGPRPGPFTSSPPTSGPSTPLHMSASGAVGNGPPAFPPGMTQSGPRFPPAMGSMPRLPAGPPQSPTTLSSRPASQPLQMNPSFVSSPAGASSAMAQKAPPFSGPPQAPPFSSPTQNMPPPPGSSPFSTPAPGMLQSSGSPYGMQTWPPQPQQVAPPPPIPGSMHQQPMFGMPPGPPPLPNQSMALSQTGQSKIDPGQIPRLTPNSAVILHDTRQGNEANPPPIPCTVDLLSTSAMQFALLVQPLALPHPSEEPIQVVDFGESGPVRCSRCKGYINPFMKFIDQGRRFICNLCGFTDETPRDYHCNLGPDGRRRDADERPELCRGTVEFIASKEYMVRDPMPAVFFFLIDVSMNAIQTGATAAACCAISQVIADLPEGPRTMVGVATFDSTIHFYNLKRALQQPLMLIVPDIQDVYTPLQSDVIVQLSECRQHLELLLENIPTMFQNNRIADSAFGAAAKAAFLAMKSTGGKLLVFQSVLPSIGIGSLSAREAEGRSNVSAGEKEAHKLLQPVDKTLKTMAIELAEYQVCVDLFITTQTYVDIASLSVVPRTTGGQVYYYYPFSALSDPAKLYNDVRWNVTRPQGFEAVMRVRCSQIDCDKTIMVSLKHDDKLQEGSECAFQCALLYTTVYGQRRIRISTLSLPCTNKLTNLFRFADLDTQFACILKQAANEIPSAPLGQVRDQATNVCINILYSYRKFCATVSASGQLILPEALKLLPLYVLALLKSNGLRSDGRIDDRSLWINSVSPLPTPLVIPLVYPRMISIHDLDEKELDGSIIPPPSSLSSEHISDDGIYLLENGEDCLIYVGNSVQPNILQQLFSISSVEEISNQQNDNPLSKKLNAIVNEIRRQRCSYLRLRLCKKGDSSDIGVTESVVWVIDSSSSFSYYYMLVDQDFRSLASLNQNMSLSEQNNRRENINHRPRNNNHFRNNLRQWVPRGSATAPAAPPSSAPASVDSSRQNDNGNVGVSVNSLVRPIPQNRNRNNFGSRGNPARYVNHQKEKEKEKEKEITKDNHERNVKVSKGGNIPQLVQEIQDKLLKGSVECMICYDMVRRTAPIWSCSSCYSIFHLNCIKKWARAPTSIDLLAEKNQGFNWRCPGCQSVQLMSSKEIHYLCFCGKRSDPPSDLYLTPHSCGEPCGKPLERELPGSGMSTEDICPHACVLQCHPGPCPPCKAFAPPRRCPCGKKVITTRCSDRKSVLTCGQRCDKLLDCGRHHCERLCHVGPCDPCQVVVNASCFCNKKIEVVLCGDMLMKGEVKVEDGVFSCSLTCEKKLICANHVCREVCHPGPCGECEYLPSKIKTCCCGKSSLNEERRSCLDPIPTCSQKCDKILPCGLHHCQDICHPGVCSPCRELVTQKCRCGSSSRTVECFKTVVESERYCCDRTCGRKKNCGRHRCSERCCPLSSSHSSPPVDWDPHLCSMPCEKKLRCGQHSCVSLCHSGHCPPCMETIFTDLTCSCGRTSIPPPLPCGTPPPSCQYPCSVPQPCGHPSSHSCHFGDCPPCSIPVAKECVGGHVVLRNIPCGSKDIRCNKLCGKTRQCGLHACSRTCHPSPCDSSTGGSNTSLRVSCGQTCGAPRRDCRHTCAALCHPSAACPDVRCEVPVTITCSCGRITATVPCDAGGNSNGYNVDTVFEASIVQKLPAPLQPAEGNSQKISLGQRKLTCDDECAKVERKKLLADAFGVTPPNLDALHFGENSSVSEVLSDLLRRDPKWVLSVEERCKYLVLGRARGGVNALKVHVFCPMSKEKRDAVRLIAERWKLSVNAAGWEPKRFVVLHVTHKSKVPARVLGIKCSNPSSMLQPPLFDPTVDMDPRLVVTLFDMPRDADISALVLRFGGECELVWLNDKNALTVFSDPGRAATAMRRLDQGSVYYGAVAVPQSSGSPPAVSGGGAWGSSAPAKDGVTLKGNPWKKVVLQDSDWKNEGSWGAEAADPELPVWKEKKEPPIVASNRWSALESGSTSKSSVRIEHIQNQTENCSVSGSKPEESGGVGDDVSGDVVDDWEKAYD
ncbi:hypothetical protein BUALT_Bualt07G0094200 [Buddleja alternifolia]|uniref:Uncharacterized protein n=1 Tax=Buddleja alternifolia TaxID=168488 RepID=A0AAV6XK73_9LAMI|nr:hypothetical protein BUALT_Bualt07G0094200 [Buddleja alternifolia]